MAKLTPIDKDILAINKSILESAQETVDRLLEECAGEILITYEELKVINSALDNYKRILHACKRSACG